MSDTRMCRLAGIAAGLLVAVFLTGNTMAQMGHVLESVGPINQSMGGAGTALPLDSMGTLQWNPAAITAIDRSEIGFGFTMLAPETNLSSTVAANSFGAGIPPVTLTGSTASDIDINPMPSFGFVYSPDDSPWSYGLGGSAIAGFGVDYPASAIPPAVMPNQTNPILTPQPGTGNGFGFGALYSSFQMLQISPTVACRVTDNLSVGVAPTFNWTSLAVEPWPAAAPNANGTYSSGDHADSRWGLGVQVGLFWEDACSGWSFGLSYKTTQWMDEYKINGVDYLGYPRQIQFDMDYPAILSMGAAYTGFHRLAIAFDVRYIDYNATDGFRQTGFDQTGAVVGFGWNSIMTASLGAQYLVTDRLSVRGGYTFNENPIDDDVAFFNIQAPAIVQNHLSCGVSYDMPHNWTFAMAYTYGFENQITGQWYGPSGAIPGTSVTSELSTHFGSCGVYVKY